MPFMSLNLPPGFLNVLFLFKIIIKEYRKLYFSRDYYPQQSGDKESKWEMEWSEKNE